MDLIKIKIDKYRPNGFLFKVQNIDRKVTVTYINGEGAAYKAGLREGDVLHSLNNEIVDFSADLLPSKLSTISDEIHLTVYRKSSIVDRSRRSLSNTSTCSDQISCGSSKNLTASMSSINLNQVGSRKQILNDNYVSEDHIDSYLEPKYKSENFDYEKPQRDSSFTEDSLNSPLKQITRKQAYKKPVTDFTFSDGPKFSVKKANKTTSFLSKDPIYVMKKKTNSKSSDTTIPAAFYQKTRVSTLPPPQNTFGKDHDMLRELSRNSCNSGSYNQLLSTSRIDDNFSAIHSPMVMTFQQSQSSDTDNVPQDDLNKSDVEVYLKIFSFNQKVRKPTYRRYMIKKDIFGVLFHSLDVDEATMPCNSTAIDPYISGLAMFMQLWLSNNTISNFFLPIGQQSYEKDMEFLVSKDAILVKYRTYEVEFSIDISKMTSDKSTVLLTLLDLKTELPEPKPVQTKKPRSLGSSENIKLDQKKIKTPRFLPESPRISLLSSLAQTELIKNVPLVVIICIKIIEKLGIKNEGIYRKSGNETAKRKLENVVFNENPETWSEYEEWFNVNTVCNVLKSVLRGFSLIDRDTAIKLSMINLSSVDESNQDQVYMDMIYHLRQHLCKTESSRTDGLKDRPSHEIRCRLDTFKYVIKHLERVSCLEEFNKMSADNLATCFSPTIIEDIPCDDNGEYQTSKKSEADKNLKQMLTFWIKYADLLCQLLEEEDDQLRYSKLTQFSENKYNINDSEHEEDDDEDPKIAIKELIEYYTVTAFFPHKFESLLNISPEITPEINNFSRLKNLGAYRSYKVNKSDINIRRSSTSLSPQEIRRKISSVDSDAVDTPVSKGLSQRTIENWASKSFKTKKRDAFIQKKELSIIDMRISGFTKDVPLVVDICINIIELHGLDVDGIYRVSGKKQDINSLEDLVVNIKNYQWFDEPYLSMWSNTYVVSCLLKSILKQLCLIKKETWVHMSSQFSDKMNQSDIRNVLMAAAYHLRHETKKAKLDMMSSDYIDIIQKECQDDIRNATLRFVLRHLKRVSQHTNNNRMTSSSLAVCFLPVLVEEDMAPNANIVTISCKGIQILEKLIDHCDWIFQWDDRPWGEMYGKVMTDSLDLYLKDYSISETAKMAKRTEDHMTAQHIINNNNVRELLRKFIAKSRILAQNRLTIRRSSYGTENETQDNEYHKSKVSDDSQSSDIDLVSESMNNSCSKSTQLT